MLNEKKKQVNKVCFFKSINIQLLQDQIKKIPWPHNYESCPKFIWYNKKLKFIFVALGLNYSRWPSLGNFYKKNQPYTHRYRFEILLNQTEIRLYLPFSKSMSYLITLNHVPSSNRGKVLFAHQLNCSVHTEKCFRNFIKWNQNQILFTIFWLISVWYNNISKMQRESSEFYVCTSVNYLLIQDDPDWNFCNK